MCAIIACQYTVDTSRRGDIILRSRSPCKCHYPLFAYPLFKLTTPKNEPSLPEDLRPREGNPVRHRLTRREEQRGMTTTSLLRLASFLVMAILPVAQMSSLTDDTHECKRRRCPYLSAPKSHDSLRLRRRLSPLTHIFSGLHLCKTKYPEKFIIPKRKAKRKAKQK